jgi:hypothetical protein
VAYSPGDAVTGVVGRRRYKVPKSKVRKKVATSTASASAQANEAAAAAARAHVAAPSSPLYIGIMLGLMILGLVWLVVYYLWGSSIPFIADLGNWNFAIGFALMIAGLLMTMRWR